MAASKALKFVSYEAYSVCVCALCDLENHEPKFMPTKIGLSMLRTELQMNLN